MKSKKLFHVCIAGIMAAAMAATTVPAGAAAFGDGEEDVAVVEAAPAGSVEEEVLFSAEESEDASQISSKAASDIKINATTFPDKNFRSYVSSMFDKDGDGSLSSSEISAVKEINVSGKDIAQLNGLKYFTSLTKLNASNNKISNAGFDGGKPKITSSKLTYINLSNNKLTQLNLSGCTGGLTIVMCNNNALTRLALPAAKYLQNLDYIDISNNKFTSMANAGISTISNSTLPSLTEVNASNNSFTSFNCSGFEGILDISNNKITTLSGGTEGYQAAAIYLEGSGNTLSKTSKLNFSTLGNRVPQRFSCNSAVKSKVVMVTPRLAATMKGSFDQVSISIGSSSDRASYTLERKVGSGAYQTIKTWSEGEFDDPEFGEDNYTDYDIQAGGTYTYRLTVSVNVQDRNKNSIPWSASKSVTVKAVPSAPSISVKNTSTRTVTITWKKVSGATGYNIFMGRSKSNVTNCIGKYLTGTSLKRSGLTKGATYYFRANAYVQSGSKRYPGSYSAVKSLNVK